MLYSNIFKMFLKLGILLCTIALLVPVLWKRRVLLMDNSYGSDEPVADTCRLVRSPAILWARFNLSHLCIVWMGTGGGYARGGVFEGRVLFLW